MKAAHTPGPWNLRFGKGIEHDYIVSHASNETLLAWTNYAKITKAQAKANARLMASSPDLLEALQAIAAGTCDTWTPGYGARQIAIAAIKKATGATP